MNEDELRSKDLDNDDLFTDDLYIKRRYDVKVRPTFTSELDFLKKQMKKIPDMPNLENDDLYEEYDNAFSNELYKVRQEEINKRKTDKEGLERARNFLYLYSDVYKDYSWTMKFWALSKKDKGYSLRAYVNKREVAQRDYESLEELNVDFISLSEFLEKAEYVGRYFKRTKPTSDGIITYMMENKHCFLLYMYDNVAICREIIDNFFTGERVERYIILSSKYLEDGNYSFYGDYIESFNDKFGIYSEIYAQEYSSKRSALRRPQ
jgi:hypothetical protein